MNFSFLSEYYPMFIEGTITTISISFVALFFGVIIGLIMCLAKISNNKFFNILASIYVEVIRGTPVMVQISIVYFGFPQIGIDFPNEFIAAAFTLSINSGAYVAEILRSGIQAVDKGQSEASRSLGLNYWSTMRYIIVPQAIKNVLPALANEFISLVKESSIISIIGVIELMFVASTVRNSTYIALEPFLVAAVIYFVLTFTLSRLVGLLEKKMSVSN